MPCGELLSGLNLCEKKRQRKYIQEAILINFKDVALRDVISDNKNNKANFWLRFGQKGFKFISTQRGASISGQFNFDRYKGKEQYTHSLDIPITGVDEESKVLLKQLDSGLYFGVLKFSDGTIELFGSEYGLRTTPYSYTGQSSSGGEVISLKSIVAEHEPPLVYSGDNSDWDDEFEGDDEEITLLGDYNDDYNNDYNKFHIFQI